MAALNWRTSFLALMNAIGSQTGVLADTARGIAQNVRASGEEYDGHYAAASDAAALWTTAATAAWQDADRVARFRQGDSAPTALAFNAHDRTDLDARMPQGGGGDSSVGVALRAALQRLNAIWSPASSDVLSSDPMQPYLLLRRDELTLYAATLDAATWTDLMGFSE